MSTPTQIVEDFCSQWDESMDKTRAAIRGRFTPHTVWDNVRFAVTTGPEEAFAL